MIQSAKISQIIVLISVAAGCALAQAPAAKVALGSETAKNGFKNETEIQNKFNSWRSDNDAQAWIASIGYLPADVESVTAVKPHGEKADVEVRIKTATSERVEGISIKLVSGPTGFNQIDKRWLSHYVKMWSIPADLEQSLKLFLGETLPTKAGRDRTRMYLNELDAGQQRAVVEFFSANKARIVRDLFRGDGPHAAGW